VDYGYCQEFSEVWRGSVLSKAKLFQTIITESKLNHMTAEEIRNAIIKYKDNANVLKTIRNYFEEFDKHYIAGWTEDGWETVKQYPKAEEFLKLITKYGGDLF
jgi:hypothetical protein